MSSEPIIVDSARKREYRDEDLLHVVMLAVDVFRQDDGMTMYIGPDGAGNLMEVGTITLRDGQIAIAHAMRPPRSKYLHTKPKKR